MARPIYERFQTVLLNRETIRSDKPSRVNGDSSVDYGRNLNVQV